MTTASKITLARVALIPVFMVVLLLGYNWAALIIFAVASLTDFVDGYIARHYNQVSDFGKFLDPLADKLLVTVGPHARLGRHDCPDPGVCCVRPADGGGLQRKGSGCRLERENQDGFHHGWPVLYDGVPIGVVGLDCHGCDRDYHALFRY